MFTEFLDLAGDKRLFVGICICPPRASTYQVEIWTGPSMGERREWYERFSCDVPKSEALDRVAGIATLAISRLPLPAGKLEGAQPAKAEEPAILKQRGGSCSCCEVKEIACNSQ